MGGSSGMNSILDIELTGKVMTIALILLIMILLLVIVLHLYAKWFWHRVEQQSSSAAPMPTPRRGRRFVFASGGQEQGLDPKVLSSLPIVVFNRYEFKDGLECAVCLCEVVNGERTRVLPKCNHGFHVECIDMWLASHVTCPLCRNNVVDKELLRNDVVVNVDDDRGSDDDADGGGQNSDPSPNFPTNVLFWGNEMQVSSGNNNACLEDGNSSSSSGGMNLNGGIGRHGGLVIDVPVQVAENSALGSASGSEEMKSPVQARLRSLKRLLSRDRRVAPSVGGQIQNPVDDVEMVLRGQPS